MNNYYIIELFYKNRNQELAVPMAKYMKNNFDFLGMKKPERMELSKEFIKESKKAKEIDWEFIDKCFELPEREFQYLSITYMDAVKNLFTADDMDKMGELIMTKSWWDSVDAISPIVGYICMKYPHIKEEVIDKWIFSDNIWLKRVSILFQLKYKGKTDTDFLSKAILNNSDTNEFFVDKAIGWALREYSKTNKEWVGNFIENNSLSKLSVKEGSKYL
ncbi:MAG TPA: DNA alkylation repair protein [Clostridiales bacterium]|jgi:3-methyladenine DNA glycosylase AlkD|nr:DNA alkylation repair protein [Clostridiales bacterium]